MKFGTNDLTEGAWNTRRSFHLRLTTKLAPGSKERFPAIVGLSAGISSCFLVKFSAPLFAEGARRGFNVSRVVFERLDRDGEEMGQHHAVVLD